MESAEKVTESRYDSWIYRLTELLLGAVSFFGWGAEEIKLERLFRAVCLAQLCLKWKVKFYGEIQTPAIIMWIDDKTL